MKEKGTRTETAPSHVHDAKMNSKGGQYFLTHRQTYTYIQRCKGIVRQPKCTDFRHIPSVSLMVFLTYYISGAATVEMWTHLNSSNMLLSLKNCKRSINSIHLALLMANFCVATRNRNSSLRRSLGCIVLLGA